MPTLPVIVTRPQPEARQWADTLSAAGVAAEALPLIEIGEAPDPAPLAAAWQRLDRFRAAMFVSANAVRGFMAASAGTAFATRAWAPGPGTSDVLRGHGVPGLLIDGPPADAAQFDSEALWAAVSGQVRTGDRVLVVRGGESDGRPAGREWLAAQLQAAGATVETVVAYVRRVPGWTDAQCDLARRAAADGSTWLFSSSEAVCNLRRLLPGQSWQGACALATHPRIAEAARQAGFAAVHECRPALGDVLASLQSLR